MENIFAVEIEKTEIKILQKKMGKKAFSLFKMEEKNVNCGVIFQLKERDAHARRTVLDPVVFIAI